MNSKGVTVEEHWTHAQGGNLLGVGRSSKDGKQLFFEFLRIEQRDKGAVYVGRPLGGKATEFARVPSEPGSLVFVNEKHDFPKRITYLQRDNALVVRIEAGRRARMWTLRRALVAP